MKKLALGTALLAVICSISTVYGQASPPAPAAATRPEVYHVIFSHAAAGKATALEEWARKAGTSSPMPGHVLFLRHEAGSPWDYVGIQHIGPKATVEAGGNPQGAALRPMVSRTLKSIRSDDMRTSWRMLS